MHRSLRIIIFVVCILLLLIPAVLLLLRNPQISTLLPFGRGSSNSSRYSIQNTVPGYTLSLTDTAYLDYFATKYGLFGQDGLVGPEFYTSKPRDTARHQINHVTFVLVDKVTDPISVAGNMPGLDCQGDFVIEGNTLVDRVAVGTEILTDKTPAVKFSRENSFLRCALNTLYYAKGMTDLQTSQNALAGIKIDIDNNLNAGVFTWPFRITNKIL